MRGCALVCLALGPCGDAAVPDVPSTDEAKAHPDAGPATAPGCEPASLPAYPRPPEPSARDKETRRFVLEWAKDGAAACPEGTSRVAGEYADDVLAEVADQPFPEELRIHYYGPPFPLRFHPTSWGPDAHEDCEAAGEAAIERCVDDDGTGYYRTVTYGNHVVEAGALLRGVLDGYAIRYKDDQAVPVFEVFFSKGKASGILKTYADGVLVESSGYRDGRRYGVELAWYKSGVLAQQAGWIGEDWIGRYLEWYRDGTLKRSAGYLAGGVEHLDITNYFPSGKISGRQGTCRGKLHGVYEFRGEDGQVGPREMYLWGEPVEDWEYTLPPVRDDG